jgi:hypothetical protein
MMRYDDVRFAIWEEEQEDHMRSPHDVGGRYRRTNDRREATHPKTGKGLMVADSASGIVDYPQGWGITGTASSNAGGRPVFDRVELDHGAVVGEGKAVWRGLEPGRGMDDYTVFDSHGKATNLSRGQEVGPNWDGRDAHGKTICYGF